MTTIFPSERVAIFAAMRGSCIGGPRVKYAPASTARAGEAPLKVKTVNKMAGRSNRLIKWALPVMAFPFVFEVNKTCDSCCG